MIKFVSATSSLIPLKLVSLPLKKYDIGENSLAWLKTCQGVFLFRQDELDKTSRRF